jgi:hypothetical protein
MFHHIVRAIATTIVLRISGTTALQLSHHIPCVYKEGSLPLQVNV